MTSVLFFTVKLLNRDIIKFILIIHLFLKWINWIADINQEDPQIVFLWLKLLLKLEQVMKTFWSCLSWRGLTFYLDARAGSWTRKMCLNAWLLRGASILGTRMFLWPKSYFQTLKKLSPSLSLLMRPLKSDQFRAFLFLRTES